MRHLILPAVVLLLFTIESTVLSLLLPKGSDYIIVPRLMFIFFLFIAVFLSRQTSIIYAFIFGILYDLLYTSIMGVYTFSFAVIVYLFIQLAKVFQIQFFLMTLFTMISLVLVDYIIYTLYAMVGIANASMPTFIETMLLPSLIFNFIFFIFLYYPFRKLLSKIKSFNIQEN
jgi:rod shape-determining protein MreD